jgi:3-methyladenine DNA glycosylase AlkC
LISIESGSHMSDNDRVRDSSTPIEELAKLASSNYKHERQFVAGNLSTPTHLLELLARDRDQSVRETVATHPKTPAQVLEKLASDEVHGVRNSVARNLNTPDRVLEKLSSQSHQSIRESVASNAKTPAQVLERLASDKDEWVRNSVAENPHTPANILENLGTEKNRFVRSSVADNPNTPVAVLENLALDKDEYVRAGVAGNPNTPAGVVEKLASDKAELVRGSAYGNSSSPLAPATNNSEHYEVLKKLAREEVWVRKAAAKNPSTPLEVLVGLGSDEELEVRFAVLNNSKMPLNLLPKMAKDTSAIIRLAVANREDCPPSVLEFLVKDKSKKVLEALSNREDLPENLRTVLQEKGFKRAGKVLEEKSGKHLTYEQIMAVKSNTERLILVGMVDDKDTLFALAKNDSTTIRREVARNKNATDEILRFILESCQGDFWIGGPVQTVREIIKNSNSSDETLKLAARKSNGANLASFFLREPEISVELFLFVLDFMDGKGVSSGSNFNDAFVKVAKQQFTTKSNNFTAEEWKIAANHESEQVRLLVARSKLVPIELFDVLAIDSHQEVREAVHKNKRAPQTARAAAALMGIHENG